MKKALFLSAIILSLLSCNDDDTLQSEEEKTTVINFAVALAKNYGPIAADGCGWVLELGSIDFSTSDLPDDLMQDSLFIFSSFEQPHDSFTCFIGQAFPKMKIKDTTKSLTRMYYAETQCSDAWGYEDTDASTANIIYEYLSDQSIEITTLKIHKSKSLAEACLACSCLSGRGIVAGVENQYINELSNLGFQEMAACSSINPMQDIAWLSDLSLELDQTAKSSRIIQYEYNNACAFLVEPCIQCPDAISTVYDIDKNVICEFGGIAGQDTCPDFYSTAINQIELYYK